MNIKVEITEGKNVSKTYEVDFEPTEKKVAETTKKVAKNIKEFVKDYLPKLSVTTSTTKDISGED